MQTPKANQISVLIVDDHPAIRAGVVAMLEKTSDICVVGEAGNEDEAKDLLAKLRPKIILLDLVMPNFSPAAFEKWARENYPETATLVLTGHDRDAYLSTMMEAGVAGYLDKNSRARQLVVSIRAAARGEIFFDKEQIERVRRWRQDVGQKWDNLSTREREILRILAEGADNNAMTVALGIKNNTVEKHLTNIYKKLGVTSRAEAIIWWLEKGGDFRN